MAAPRSCPDSQPSRVPKETFSMLTERSSGILLHPTSLPGPYGCGDIGADAYVFLDWLAASGQSVWQMLPLGPVGIGNSPYMSSSAFAGNPLLIDLASLGRLGWLTPEDLIADADADVRRVDYARQSAFRLPRLRRAAQAFAASAEPEQRADLAAYCQAEAGWLDDYALFMALDAAHPGLSWNAWPAPLAQRRPAALKQAARQHAGEIGFWKFCQWQFDRQWSRLKVYANQRGVRILGDVPIFVAHHSADVWAHQDLFELDAHGAQAVVAGVPPDYFSPTGQRWGNPLYRWSAHQADGYAWWLARMARALALADQVRIDHFRGFAAYWEIPATEDNAVHGRWVAAPGRALFDALRRRFPDLPIIAEDLGDITEEVLELRDAFGLPGMRILQFAFGGDAGHGYLPHNYPVNCVAYIGTHDNDTAQGWWQAIGPRERAFVQHYLGSDGHDVHWALMRALSASVARCVIYSMQDVLGLDGSQRMNVPGVCDGNWEWRFSWDQVQSWQATALRQMAAVHGRTGFGGVDLPN
jgi:4-alpha-glucanotransferase